MRIRKIQIEPTTFCNLDCRYCFRNSSPAGKYMDLEIVEKISDCAESYVVYGFGEPMLHDGIGRILETLNGRVTISTNGMLDFESIIHLVDKIGISVDTSSEMRRGMKIEEVFRRMRVAGDRGFVEIVVTRKNIRRLRDLVETAAQNGLGIFASNMIAPTEQLYREAVYFEGSKESVEAVMGMGVDEKFILEAIRDCSRGGGKRFEAYRRLIDSVYGRGYSVNILSIIEDVKRIETAMEAERIFEELKDVADSYGVEFESPSFFGDAKGRECPYEESIFVRADGRVSSCMSFAYNHVEFVNSHRKFVREFTVGDLNYADIDGIVDAMREFEILRSDMDGFPWCADCPYVGGCWYAKKNDDCYGNSPSCSECLYGCKIARCLM